MKGEHFETFFITALHTGLRKGELLGLRWKDVNFQEKEIHIRNNAVSSQNVLYHITSKTEAGYRTIPLSNVLFKRLVKQRKEQAEINLKLPPGVNNNDIALVFLTWSGGKLHYNSIRRALRRIIKNNDLPYFTLKTLRHTFATRLKEAGIPATVARDLPGHSDIRTTLQIYTHTTEKSKKEAIKKLENVIS